MSTLHAHLGQRLDVELPGGAAARLRVVGKTVVPPSAAAVIGTTNAQGFGEGAVLTYAALSKLARAAAPPPTAFIALRRGEHAHTVARRLQRELGPGVAPVAFQRPNDLFNFGRIRNLPLLFATIVALLGIATLVHILLSTVRRRGREIGVLKMLGMNQGDVRSVIAWQSAALTIAALVFGVPLGIAAGRTGWRIFADEQGVLAEPHIPVLAITVVIAGALITAALVAIAPGGRAARLSTATALHEE